MLNPRGRSPFLLLDPTLIEEKGWPLEKAAFRGLQLILLACPFWWAIDSKEIRALLRHQGELAKIQRKYNVRRAQWVLAWVPLLALLWALNPTFALLKWVAVLAALFRLLEISATGLGTILAQVQQIQARNVVTIGFYAIQVTFVFAILYHCLAAGAFVSGTGEHASGALDYFYTSWSNVTSLGGSYEPETGTARFLTSMTTTFGIFLLSVLLAFGIDEVKETGDDD